MGNDKEMNCKLESSIPNGFGRLTATKFDPFDEAFERLVRTTEFLSACYQNQIVKKEVENGKAR